MIYNSKRASPAAMAVSKALPDLTVPSDGVPIQPIAYSAIQPVKRLNPGAVRDPLQPGYVTVCFSTYPELLVGMDAIVERCREAGNRTASRSWLIREAMACLDVERLVRGQSRRRR